jgi:hypothetical protein
VVCEDGRIRGKSESRGGEGKTNRQDRQWGGG